MPDLLCSVRECSYNSDHLCALNEIHVDGENATDSHTTFCGSFQDGSDSVTNCEHCGSASKETEIGCDAQNCQYNEDCYCNASEINVAGCGSNTAKGTECSTFRPK